MNNIRNILILLQIIQVKTRVDSFKVKTEIRRANPYNPLTYIALSAIFIVGVIMFGFVGVWKEVELKNIFKWNR
jgi:hypothetical protein